MVENDSETVVTKTIVVKRDIEGAFKVWTEQIREWWPAGHSLSGDPQTKVFIEGKAGGRFYERTSNGDEIVWGQVIDWEPPRRLVHTWFLGSSSYLPSRVEIVFVSLGENQTQVEIAHRGPELIGQLWWKIKSRFRLGWETSLAQFANFDSR